MPSLKHKFLLCKSLSVLLAVLLLGSLSYWLMVDALTAAQREHLEFVAQDTAKAIETYLARQKDQLERIKTLDSRPRRNNLPRPEDFSRFHQQFPALSYLNPEGREELSFIAGQVSDQPGDWISRPLFRRALSQPDTVILSPLEYNQQLNQPVVWAISAHQPDSGQGSIGALAGAIPLSSIISVYRELSQSHQEFISLIDRKGQLLDHPQRDQLGRVALFSGPDAQRIALELQQLQGGFGRMTLLDVDGFVAYAPIPSLHCSVLVTLPHAAFMAAPNRLRWYALLTCLGVLGAGMILSSVMVDRLTGDLDRITRHTRLVAGGDLGSRVLVRSKDEIAALAHAFNGMTENLQRAHRDREAQHAILQSIIDPLVVTDSAGLIIQANPAAHRLLDYSPEDLIGRPLEALFTSEEGLRPFLGFAGLRTRGGVRDHETLARTRQGTQLPVLFSCAPAVGQHPQGTGLVAIFKDISDRRQAENARNLALQEAEAARDKLTAILKSAADGLLVTHLDQTIVLMNSTAEKLLDLPLTTAANRPLGEVIRDPALLAHLAAATRGEGELAPIDLTGNDGHTMIQAHSALITNARGEKTGVITLLRDVTQERRLERMKNEFISTAAHELRTPLTSVMGYAELLITPESFGEFSAGERQEFLREIHAKSEVLARIITDLLDISRIESGQPIPLQMRLDDLGKTLAKVVRHFERHSPRHHFVLELPEAAPVQLCFDADRIVQVLENLLSNAVKYAPGGGVVRVRLEQLGETVKVCVTDQGIGMSREQVERIFDKFYRADASNTGVGGLGLGMSIVRSLVVAHGGRIWVESTQGLGTSVHFSLPLMVSAAASAFLPCR